MSSLLVELFEQLRDHRRRVLQVAVEHDDGVGVAVVQTGEQRHLVAEARRHDEKANRRIGAGDLLEDVQRRIAAAIHHIQDRRVIRILYARQHALQLRMENLDYFFFLIDRTNYR